MRCVSTNGTSLIVSIFILFTLACTGKGEQQLEQQQQQQQQQQQNQHQQTYIRTPVSGVNIPASLVAAQIPVSERHPSGLSHHVYEWDATHNILHSTHKQMNLGRHRRRRTTKLSFDTSVSLNGVPMSMDDPRVGDAQGIITTSPDGKIEAVYHSGDLIHVYGQDGFHLRPLSHQHHNLFVASTSDPSIHNLANDMSPEQLTDMLSQMPNRNDTTGEGDENNITFTTTETMEPMTNECLEGKPHYVKIAMAYDSSLCRYYKNDIGRTFAMIAVLFEIASTPFVQDTCVRLALTSLEAHCDDITDPYVSLRGLVNFNLLLGFARIWFNSSRKDIPRDIAYFISGSNDGSTDFGLSIPGGSGVCNPSFSWGWVEGILPPVFAAGIATALKANRSTTGLVTGTYEPGMMIPRLAQNSIDSLTQFIDSNPLSSCITTTKPRNVTLPIIESPPSPIMLPGEYGSCDVGRRQAHVIACTKPRVIGTISPPSNLSSLGPLIVRSWQDFGMFHVQVQVRKSNVHITQFRTLQNFNRTVIPTRNGLVLRQDGSDDMITSTAKAQTSTLQLRWPRNALTCCDQRLYIITITKWCLKKNSHTCATVSKTLSRKVPCSSVCFGKRGKVVKMSKIRKCPACL